MDLFSTGARGGVAASALPDVTVVFPCLNEEASVGRCVRDALRACAVGRLSAEVVVVDNNSTDGSVAAATAAGARVVAERRSGYGSALQAGIRAARGRIVVMADADCTYELSRIPDLVGPIQRGSADLVLGARLQSASHQTMPLLHRFVGTPVLTFLVARAAGGELSISDSQSGFRAFRRDRMLDLGLRGSGMEFASEMLVQAVRAGWRIGEIPTQYSERVGDSKLNTIADGWRHLQLIATLAPDLALVWPGAASLLLGLGLSLASMLFPAGLPFGSLLWQPLFFAPIATVVGAQTLLAGCVLAHRSSLLAGATKRRFAFVGRPAFPYRCMRGGLLGAWLGLVIDGVLFVVWILGFPAPALGVPLASLAQTLLITGTTVAVFGLVIRLTLDRRRRELGVADVGLDDFLPDIATEVGAAVGETA